MTWSTIEFMGKSADVGEFDSTSKPAGVVLFLHGYDGVTLKDNETYTQELKNRNLIGLCPHGEHCWWTDAIYEPFDATQSPIDFLAQSVPRFCRDRWQIESPRIAVCGVEMGGQGALQLAYRHARLFPTVVAISPKVDFEQWWGHGTSLDQIFPNREAARQRTATLHLHPLNYPKNQLLLCDPADRYCLDGVLTLASKLSSTGILFEQDFESSHGGFGWAYTNAMAPQVIRYIQSKLPVE
jgi:S-formylglutathione hydrolase FrmB